MEKDAVVLVRIPEMWKQALSEMAEREDRSISAQIRRVLRQYLIRKGVIMPGRNKNHLSAEVVQRMGTSALIASSYSHRGCCIA